MAREYQNGDGFGYILGFRKKDTSSWTEVRVPRVESSRHVYYNSSLAAYTPFEVKIKAYNRKGEGPFSQVAVVHSAEEGEYRWRSATSTTVWSLWQMSQCPSELLLYMAALIASLLCTEVVCGGCACALEDVDWFTVNVELTQWLWAHLHSVLFKWHEWTKKLFLTKHVCGTTWEACHGSCFQCNLLLSWNQSTIPPHPSCRYEVWTLLRYCVTFSQQQVGIQSWMYWFLLYQSTLKWTSSLPAAASWHVALKTHTR